MYSLALIRTPTHMNSAGFDKQVSKRVKKDTAKISKAFEKLNKESEERRKKIESERDVRMKKLSSSFDDLFKKLDETARADVERLKTLFVEDSEETVDLEDFTEVEETFKSIYIDLKNT